MGAKSDNFCLFSAYFSVFPLICGWNIEYLYVLENIDIDKEISENIDIDKILNRLEFGISNRATYYPHHSARVTEW